MPSELKADPLIFPRQIVLLGKPGKMLLNPDAAGPFFLDRRLSGPIFPFHFGVASEAMGRALYEIAPTLKNPLRHQAGVSQGLGTYGNALVYGVCCRTVL